MFRTSSTSASTPTPTAARRDRRGPHALVAAGSMVLVLVTAFAVFATSATAASVRVVTGADAGTTVHLKRGQRLTVRLDESPSTGYGWRVVRRPASSVLRTGLDFYKQGPCAPRAVGCPGTHTFRYTERGAGTTHLTIRLFAPGTDQAVQTFRITVVGA